MCTRLPEKAKPRERVNCGAWDGQGNGTEALLLQKSAAARETRILKKNLARRLDSAAKELYYNGVISQRYLERAMEEKTSATLESIQRAAMQEFLDKGFQGASLRQIVKNAGVTTGAFYGYFSSKEALFNALVEPHAAALMGRFMEAQTTFAELPEEEQPQNMGRESGECVRWMVEYICRHREPVKLLLCKAEGTSYERFVHNMVEVEVEYTLQYMDVLRRLGKDIPVLDKSLCHIIASGMLGGIFEVVIHDMPYEQAMGDVEQLLAFYTAGWLKLMGE